MEGAKAEGGAVDAVTRMQCQAMTPTYHGDSQCLRKAKAGGSLCWQHERMKDWGRSGIELAADLLEEVAKRREARMDIYNERERIEHEFTYHAPKAGQPERYTALREEGKALALSIHGMVPDCYERGMALVKLQEAIFWANAAIARNE